MKPPMHATRTPHETTDAQQRAQEILSRAADSAALQARHAGEHFVGEPAKDLLGAMKAYAKQKPDVVALWCFGLGAWVGWRLRG